MNVSSGDNSTINNENFTIGGGNFTIGSENFTVHSSSSGSGGNNKSYPEELNYMFKVVFGFQNYFFRNVFPGLAAIGGFWNLLIIVYFVKINLKKGLKRMSSYHFLIINLALIDLSICSGIAIFSHFLVKESWELPAFACPVLDVYFTDTASVTSCWVLTLISFARYRSIVHPMSVKINKKKYGLAGFLIWVIPAVINIYDLIKVKKVYDSEDGTYSCEYVTQEDDQIIDTQTVVNSVLDSFIPLALMVYFYRKMSKAMHRDEHANTFSLSNQSRLRNRTALQTIKGLTLLFIYTVLTTRVLHFIKNVMRYYYKQNSPKSKFYIVFGIYIHATKPLNIPLFFSNNMLNVFIYARMIPGFRRFLLAVFTLGLYSQRDTVNS